MANKISYVKNDEPAFIKAFKQKSGYKEGPTVDSKREELAYEDEDRSDNEDEKPVVVVLKEGDLTAEEVQETKKHQNPDEDGEPEDGRITFKKPTKRQSDVSSDLNVSSTKKQREDRKKKQPPSKVVKNSSLLSFDDDEEDT